MLDTVYKKKKTVNNIYSKIYLATFSIRPLVWKAESTETSDLLSLGFVDAFIRFSSPFPSNVLGFILALAKL